MLRTCYAGIFHACWILLVCSIQHVQVSEWLWLIECPQAWTEHLYVYATNHTQSVIMMTRSCFHFLVFCWQGSKIWIRAQNWPPRTLQTQKHKQIRRLRGLNPMEDGPNLQTRFNLYFAWPSNPGTRDLLINSAPVHNNDTEAMRTGSPLGHTQIAIRLMHQTKQHYSRIFVLGTFFRKCYLPEGLAKKKSPNCRNPKSAWIS